MYVWHDSAASGRPRPPFHFKAQPDDSAPLQLDRCEYLRSIGRTESGNTRSAKVTYSARSVSICLLLASLHLCSSPVPVISNYMLCNLTFSAFFRTVLFSYPASGPPSPLTACFKT